MDTIESNLQIGFFFLKDHPYIGLFLLVGFFVIHGAINTIERGTDFFNTANQGYNETPSFDKLKWVTLSVSVTYTVGVCMVLLPCLYAMGRFQLIQVVWIGLVSVIISSWLVFRSALGKRVSAFSAKLGIVMGEKGSYQRRLEAVQNELSETQAELETLQNNTNMTIQHREEDAVLRTNVRTQV